MKRLPGRNLFFESELDNGNIAIVNITSIHPANLKRFSVDPDPPSTAKKRCLNQTLDGGHRRLQFGAFSIHRRISRLGERQRLHAALLQRQTFSACTWRIAI